MNSEMKYDIMQRIAIFLLVPVAGLLFWVFLLLFTLVLYPLFLLFAWILSPFGKMVIDEKTGKEVWRIPGKIDLKFDR
jgi:hypothetical protein